MSRDHRYEQDVVSERYTQPFRSVARVISAFPGRNGNERIIRKVAKVWIARFRRPLSRLCVLPDVLLIGASKCGTSSMAAHLSAHPDCMPPFYKEVRYFDSSRIPAADYDGFRAHFPTVVRRGAKQLVSGRRAWTADFSPTYFDHPHAPRRVFEVLGSEVRLVLMLRNPVDRAYSQYRFQRGIGNEREEDFAKALDLEASRVAGEAERRRADEAYDGERLVKFGYVTRGLYRQHLESWHRYFDPSQLWIVRFEDFASDPQQVFDGVCDFLEVPRQRIRNQIHNASKLRRAMPPGVRARLVERFRPHNRELSEYLARDFDWDR